MPDIVTAKTVSTAASVFTSLTNYLRRRNSERMLQLLESDEISLEQACHKDPYYVACFIRTADAIERATSKEKVDILRNFFIYCEKDNLLAQQPDRYAEALSIIAELSRREIQILILLSEGGLMYKNDPRELFPDSDESKKSDSAALVFKKARDYCAEKLTIDENMVDALLARLQRTGLLITSPAWKSSIYFFSPLYLELKELITYGYYEQ